MISVSKAQSEEGNHEEDQATGIAGQGTHKGELAGIAPTNKSVVVMGIDIFRVGDSQLTELWLSWDQMGMMQQLGVIPSQEEEE